MIRPENITTLAGTGEPGGTGDDGPAASARLHSPRALCLDNQNHLFVADWGNARIRKVDLATGMITAVGGNGSSKFSGDGGPAAEAGLDPRDLATDDAGNLYVADYSNHRIRKIDSAGGIISTIAGNGSWIYDGDGRFATSTGAGLPTALAVDRQGTLYFVDNFDGFGGRLRKLNRNTATLSTIGGADTVRTGDEGPATSANLGDPVSISLEPGGNLLLADRQSIRRVTPNDGRIHHVAGSYGQRGFSGDGGPASSALFQNLKYVSAASGGDILVMDAGNYRTRRIRFGIIETVAGTGTGDNTPASATFLNFPRESRW